MTFHDVFWNVLKDDGSLVINIKDKIVNGARHRYVWDTIMQLSNAGWVCIDDYVWHKPNAMPGFWPTRLRDGWEYCFHLAKCTRPYINQDAVRIPIGDWAKNRLQNLGKNDLDRQNSKNKSGFGRDISRWVGKETVLPQNVISAAVVGRDKGHPAVFPVELPSFFIKLLSRPNSLIIDPFGGSGTTGLAALNLSRNALLVDANEQYCRLAFERVRGELDAPDDKVIVVKQTDLSKARRSVSRRSQQRRLSTYRKLDKAGLSAPPDAA